MISLNPKLQIYRATEHAAVKNSTQTRASRKTEPEFWLNRDLARITWRAHLSVIGTNSQVRSKYSAY